MKINQSSLRWPDPRFKTILKSTISQIPNIGIVIRKNGTSKSNTRYRIHKNEINKLRPEDMRKITKHY